MLVWWQGLVHCCLSIYLVLVCCGFDVGCQFGASLLQVSSEPLRCHQCRFGAGWCPAAAQCCPFSVSSVPPSCPFGAISVSLGTPVPLPHHRSAPPLRPALLSPHLQFHRWVSRVFFPPASSLHTRRREPPMPTPRPHPAALSPSPLLPTPSYISPSSPAAGTFAAAVPTCPAIGSPGCSCPR